MDFSQVAFYYTFKSWHYWAERTYSVLSKRENERVHVLGTDCQIHLDIKYNRKIKVKPKGLLENCIYLFIFGWRKCKKLLKTAFGERYNRKTLLT